MSKLANHYDAGQDHFPLALKRLLIPIAIVVSIAPRCTAQQPGDIPSYAVATPIVSRAQEFLRAVASLSPMPADADRDRSQLWPRRTFREIHEPGSGEEKHYVRNTAITVIGNPNSRNLRSGPAWDVSFYGGTIVVTIRATSGNVLAFRDGALAETIGFDNGAPDEGCIAREQAIARAVKYLSAANVNTDGLVLESANLVRYGNRSADVFWDLDWHRTWRGVPFMDQKLNVSIDAVHGRLLSIGSALGLPAPMQTTLNTNPGDAADSLRGYLKAHNEEPLGESTILLKLVNPAGSAETRIAWVVTTPVKWAVGGWAIQELWVDSSTRAIIGRDLSVVRSNRPPNSLGVSLLQTLSSSTRLKLFPLESGAEKLSGRIESAANPLRYYGIVSQCIPIKSSTKDAKILPTHKLVVTQRDGKQITLDYDVRSGIAIDSSRNMLLAPGFRRLLLSQASQLDSASSTRPSPSHGP